MSKQDRQGVRTATDIERKYNLGQLNDFRGQSQKQDLALTEIIQTVNQFIADTNAKFNAIDRTVDEAINESLAEAKASGEFDGEKGEPGVKGEPGEKGDAGVSPTADVTTIEGGHRVTITDVNGTKTFDVMDGEDGTSAEGVEWEKVNNKPSTYPPSSHNHTWDSVQSKPSTFPPSSHSHSWDSVTGKPSNLVKVLSKTYTASTNSNGNANTSIATSGYIILSISAKDSDGSENYLCNLYRSSSGGGRWYVNVTTITSKEIVKSTSFTFTIYYAAV